MQRDDGAAREGPLRPIWVLVGEAGLEGGRPLWVLVCEAVERGALAFGGSQKRDVFRLLGHAGGGFSSLCARGQ